jgi:poly-gamma-glutamate synthesis protein (capsule biosynthesis protein)
MYLVTLEPGAGRLTAVRLLPMQVRRFRLRRASDTDARWLDELLNRWGAPFGTRVEMAGERGLLLRWGR